MTDQHFWVLLATMHLILSDLATGRGNYRYGRAYQGIAFTCIILSVVTGFWSNIHA